MVLSDGRVHFLKINKDFNKCGFNYLPIEIRLCFRKFVIFVLFLFLS